MGISAEALKASLEELGRLEPAFAAAYARVGHPEPRISDPGYVTLLRAIGDPRPSFGAGPGETRDVLDALLV